MLQRSLLLFVTFFLSCSTPQTSAPPAGDRCKEVRGAFDIGSGSTKTKVALIDRCLKIIEASLHESSDAVPYAADLSAHGGVLSQDIGEEGLLILQNLRTRAEKAPQVTAALAKIHQGGVIWKGFATSAFRQASNGKEVIAGFAEALDVPLEVISHEREAELGYASGVLAAPAGEGVPVVWDIGGGSQQIVYRSEAGLQRTLIEGRASYGFKDQVIRTIQKKDPARVKTPNPIGRARARAAVAAVRAFIPEKIPLPQKPKVIGIGGVFQAGIPSMTGVTREVSWKVLDSAIDRNADKDDAALKSKYASTDVTNLILVRGMMEKLGVKSVTISPHAITDAFLLESVK